MKNIKLKSIVKLSSIVGTILFIWFIIYGIKTGIFIDELKLQDFLNKTGFFAPAIFIIVQIIQVIIPIIPGGASCAIGVIIFGPFWGFIYNYFSIVAGSIMVFFISRKYGMNLIKKMFSEKTINKYIGWLDENKRFEKFFAIAIFLPVAPDDFLCYLAGVTKISVKNYLLIIFLLKPFSILAYSLGLVYLTSLLKLIFI